MNITLTDTQQAAIDREAASRSTTEKPMTADSLAAFLLGSACDSYAASQADADKSAMAANPRFMALATAVAAKPDKFDAVEAAVLPILNS